MAANPGEMGMKTRDVIGVLGRTATVVAGVGYLGVWQAVLLLLALVGIYLALLAAEPTALAVGDALQRLIARLWR